MRTVPQAHYFPFIQLTYFFLLFFQQFLCEGSYVLLEYARTAMFMWMFIEGLYLNSLISVSVFQSNFPYIVYAALGWGLPIIMTAIWSVFTAQNRMGLK